MANEALRIYGPREHLGEAVRIALREFERFADYDKVGWGWRFSDRSYPGASFFVRRIKDGLSVKITVSAPA